MIKMIIACQRSIEVIFVIVIIIVTVIVTVIITVVVTVIIAVVIIVVVVHEQPGHRLHEVERRNLCPGIDKSDTHISMTL